MFTIKNAAGDVAEILLYDEIGFWGIEAKDFIEQLSRVTAPKIDLRINSPGGDVFDGWAMFNALDRHDAEITTHVDGLAASMASLIMLAGSTRHIADNAMVMIHNPWTVAIGDANEMRKTAGVLDKVGDSGLEVYEAKTELTRAQLVDMLDAETWINATEARDMGFADTVEGESDVAAVAICEDLGYRNVPERFAVVARGRRPEAPPKDTRYKTSSRRRELLLTAHKLRAKINAT